MSKGRKYMSDMHGVNKYWRQLSDAEIEKGVHRKNVGALWEEIGLLQYEFMKSRGLLPSHTLLDIGCGAMRGGLHFIRYLEPGNYIGLDINESLLKAARREIATAGLSDKRPVLIQDENFDFRKVGRKCDTAMAMSLFTHLHANLILRCLFSLRDFLLPEGVLYATYFEAPGDGHLADIEQCKGISSHFDADPYHYSRSFMQ